MCGVQRVKHSHSPCFGYVLFDFFGCPPAHSPLLGCLFQFQDSAWGYPAAVIVAFDHDYAPVFAGHDRGHAHGVAAVRWPSVFAKVGGR